MEAARTPLRNRLEMSHPNPVGGVSEAAIEFELAQPTCATLRITTAALSARIARRRGAKKAAVAVAHSMLVAVWHILKHHQPYQDLGASHFDRLHTQRLARHYLHRLEQLGVKVSVEDAA